MLSLLSNIITKYIRSTNIYILNNNIDQSIDTPNSIANIDHIYRLLL